MSSDLIEAKKAAVAATKARSTWAYRNNYAGLPKVSTISTREPTSHTLHLTGLHSWDYAKVAGCSLAAARNHLGRLAKAGLIIERKGWSGIRDFTLVPEEAEALGREIIAELRAEGLPYDDEWRAARDGVAAE
ncbi:hypothetical protein SAMN02800692_1537 [Luteibacter sp. UNC138MFCol5.1]|uniref:hypothetical protein n=1 Tax=Luteibacter sp. UNC138MFCol5.1 TaxID=1502774 RepID=UPI0008D01872|nr:hypothetical protein [Luteibacter sp. UNC138MFCol5.1]SEO63811.1 hypothetical protein SAMN02800692_1537 [Luteibacter sp. UNC138MFCol5.1]